jgi:hypothetical protein
LWAKKKGDAGMARPWVDEDDDAETGGVEARSKTAVPPSVLGGGVDRHETLSDTRFSVRCATAGGKPAARYGRTGVPSNRLTNIDLRLFPES